MGRHQRVVRGPVRIAQRQVGEIDWGRRTATHGDVEGISTQNLKPQGRAILGHPVKCAAISIGDRLGRQQDTLEQRQDVALT